MATVTFTTPAPDPKKKRLKSDNFRLFSFGNN